METKDYIWYIVPGTILLIPIIEYVKLFDISLKFEIINILLAYSIGFLIHQFFRLITFPYYFACPYCSCCYKRKLLREFESILEPKHAKDVDRIYNMCFYSNKEFKDFYDTIRRKSSFSVAAGTNLIAFLFGLVLWYQISNVPMFILYSFSSIILIFLWLLLEEDINKREILFFNKNLGKVSKECKKMIRKRK